MNKKTKNKRTTRTILIASAAVLLVAALAVGAWALFFRAPDKQWAMKVNGEPVWEEEFSFLMKENRASLQEKVKQEHGEAAISQEEYLKEVCKLVAVEAKVRQQVAVSLGIAESFDYFDLQSQMQNKNKENEQAVKESKPVYGLLRYDFQQYYSYVVSNADLRTKENLTNTELKPSEEEVARYYEENKDILFSKVDGFTYLLITGKEDEEALTLLKQLDGKTEAEIEAFCQQNSQLSIQREEVDADSYRTLAKTEEPLATALIGLEAGQMSNVLENGEKYQRIYCVSRSEAGVESLEEARPTVINSLVDEKFEAKIAALVKEAKVEYNSTYFTK